jgi:hypothetical protein
MPQLEKTILERINNLLSVGGRIDLEHERKGTSSELAREVYLGTLSIISNLYGPKSPQLEAVLESNSRIMKYKWSETLKNSALILELRGVLSTTKAEIEAGLLKSIRGQARGEILADFIILAKDAIDNGVKDVAAVLSCAALEDGLKRFAESIGLEVEAKDLSEVINALKAAGALAGPQAKVIQSFVGIRNRAMHADWEKMDTSEVHSVIGFVQDFVAKRF